MPTWGWVLIGVGSAVVLAAAAAAALWVAAVSTWGDQE